MIKINLAPKGTARAAGPAVLDQGGSLVSVDLVRKEGLKRIFIIVVPTIALMYFESTVIPEKKNMIQVKTQAYNQLVEYNSKQSDSVAEIKKFIEDEKLVQERINTIEKINKDRFREIRVLDLIQQVIPEKAWLKKITIGMQKVSIHGVAINDFEITSFMESLSKSAFLLNVELIASSEEIIDGVAYKQFELSCFLETPK